MNPLQGLGDLNKMRQQAVKMQQALQGKQIVVEKGEVRVVISGDQRILEFTVQGYSSQDAVDALNDAIKQSQKLAAEKLKEIAAEMSWFGGRA